VSLIESAQSFHLLFQGGSDIRAGLLEVKESITVTSQRSANGVL